MFGNYFWFSIILLVVTIIGTIFYLVFKPIFRTYLHINQGWQLVGWIICILFGYYVAGFFSMYFCMGIRFGWLCYWLLRFVFTVGFGAIFYKFFILPDKYS